MCFLIPILTGLLGALLGCLICRKSGNNFKAEYDSELEKNRKLSAELDAAQNRYGIIENDFKTLKSSSSDWEGKYNSLNADYDAHKNKFATLESEFNSLKSSSATANSEIEAKYNADLDSWKTKYAALEAEYQELKNNNSNSEGTALGLAAGAAIASSTQEVEGVQQADVNVASADSIVDSTANAKDDLKKIEGIGPKIEELLNAKGIYTFAQLADANDEDTQSILKEAGSRFQMHDTSTWNEQAALARDGKWDELNALQAQLNAGRGNSDNATPNYIFDSESAKTLYGQAVKEDDLKIVEGIGPKIEELFHNAGIKTWKALSELSTEQCQEILATGGERFQMHNPSTWPKQCELAYHGKWEELKKWQDELDAGKA